MHTKFQVAEFQNKTDIRHRSLYLICLYYSDIYVISKVKVLQKMGQTPR